MTSSLQTNPCRQHVLHIISITTNVVEKGEDAEATVFYIVTAVILLAGIGIPVVTDSLTLVLSIIGTSLVSALMAVA